MKCKKCEEEITEGNLCESCKKKRNTDLMKYTVIVVLIVLLVGASVWAMKKNNTSKESNTVANLYNYGYAVEGKNLIFYAIPDEQAKYMNIYSMKKDGSDNKIICDRDWNVASLNLVGDWIYFIAYETVGESTEEQENSAKIYKMKTNGSDIKEITDDVTTQSYQIAIIKNEIYYMNDEYQICKVSINGGEPSLVSEDTNGFVAIKDGYIYYADNTTENYVMTKMNLNDLSDKKQIIGDTMYDINIIDGYIYFSNSDESLCKVSVDGGDVTTISNVAVYNLNISGDYAYYMRYENPEKPEEKNYAVGLYKMKLDGTGEEKLKQFKNYSSFINVVGDWIMYSDNDDKYGYMSMIKTDGSEDKTLYTFDFSTMEDETTNNAESNPEENAESNPEEDAESNPEEDAESTVE